MPFDYDLFEAMAAKEYSEASRDYMELMKALRFPYTFADVMAVFCYFFWKYRAFSGEDHIPLKGEQIRDIIEAMPFVWNGHSEIDVSPEEYPALIDAYFSIPYRNCNHRIFHFFSGSIRRFLLYRLECEKDLM